MRRHPDGLAREAPRQGRRQGEADRREAHRDTLHAVAPGTLSMSSHHVLSGTRPISPRAPRLCVRWQ